MMQPYTWSPDQTLEEQKNGAYWERNMMVLLFARSMSGFSMPDGRPAAGWYPHQGEGFDGWSRVVSFYGGAATFHVPDDFDLGDLKQIEPNWDGHTTHEKWTLIMQLCKCDYSET